MDRSYPKVLGWELFKLRGARDQADVCREFGFEQSALSQWENGNAVPTLPFLVRLVHRAYGASVEDLLIRVAADAVWDPGLTLLKFPEGLRVLAAIPKDQPLLSALVTHDLASHIPLHTYRARRAKAAAHNQKRLQATGVDLTGFSSNSQRVAVLAELLRTAEPRYAFGLARTLGLKPSTVAGIVRHFADLGWLQQVDVPNAVYGSRTPRQYFNLSEVGVRHAREVVLRYS